ncbi:MAG TPA: methyltransferase [Armatimonadota bacterium]|jgi:SAM-dependent methyltransferase
MPSSTDRIWETARGFMASRVILSGVEIGVFEALGNGPCSSQDVAATLKTDPRATDRLLNALVVQGLLLKQGGLFRNSEAAEQCLVPGRPGYAADGLMHTAHLWHTWTNLTEAVRNGKTPAREEATSANRADAFIAAMHHNAMSRAPLIVGALDLTGVNRLLDIGGGSADYAMAFCRAKNGLTATVFDLPDICPITQGYIDRAGLADRVNTYGGNYLQDAFPGGYDLALLSAVIHSNSPDETRLLFSKAFRALNPGGRIVVADWFMDDERVNPPGGAMFALNMLVGTESGDTYTESETAQWLSGAGFDAIRRTDLAGGATSLMIGSKPR